MTKRFADGVMEVNLCFPDIGSHLSCVEIPENLLDMPSDKKVKKHTDLYLYVDERLISLYDRGDVADCLRVGYGRMEHHHRECDYVMLRHSGHIFHRVGNGLPVLVYSTFSD